MLRSQGRPIEILLVEDDAAHAALIADAIRGCGVACTVNSVDNGKAALAYVAGEGDFMGRPRPDLVILDLNMPDEPDGRRVLEVVKKDPLLHRVPVVVLTASSSEDDVSDSYHRNANAYVVKPQNADDFTKAMKALAAFWLEVVTLIPR